MIKSIKSKANNETRSLKNIIDSKEAEITSYQSNQMALYAEVKKLKKENDELRLFKIKAVEEAKKEADELMIKKITMYENKLAKYGKKEKK